MTIESTKPYVWSMIVGAVVCLIIIFSTGWAVKSTSAQIQAEDMAKQAVIDNLAPICVAQFLQEPNTKEQLKAWDGQNTWVVNREVEKRGWAVMPGSKSPIPEVIYECAKLLKEIDWKQ